MDNEQSVSESRNERKELRAIYERFKHYVPDAQSATRVGAEPIIPANSEHIEPAANDGRSELSALYERFKHYLPSP